MLGTVQKVSTSSTQAFERLNNSPYARHCEAAVFAAEAISNASEGIASSQRKSALLAMTVKLRNIS